MLIHTAGHLPQKQHDYRRKYRTLASTYVTFGPDGNELLVNLGGEQIYLFDVNRHQLPQRFDISIRQKIGPAVQSEFKGCLSFVRLISVMDSTTNSFVIKKLCIALHGKPISELRGVTCRMGSHSVTATQSK